MKYSVAEAVRILAGWKPGSSEQHVDDDEAARSLLDKDSGFRKTLLARLLWACGSQPEISSRFPINPRRSAERAFDEHLLEELAQEIFMLLLEPGKPFGSQNAFGVLKGAMERRGDGDWSDADCLVFLLGKKGKRYLLPRPGQPVGDCPAIWLWVAMKWRARSQRQWESQTILRHTGLVGSVAAEAGQKVIGQHNGAPLLARSQAEEPEANLDKTISAVQKWPAEQRNLLVEALRPGSEILKAATVERLRNQKEKPVDGLAKCFSVSAIGRFLNVGRTVAEGLVRELSDRLLALPIPIPNSSLAIQALREALLAGAVTPPMAECEK